MNKDVLYVSPSRYLGNEAKVFTTIEQAYRFLENSTDSVFIVDKKAYKSLQKMASSAFISCPNTWAFNRLTMEHKDCIKGRL